MTLLQQALAHYVEICSRSMSEKRNGWQCAQELAAKHPEMLGELPEALKAEMLRRKSQEQLTAQGGKSDADFGGL